MSDKLNNCSICGSEPVLNTVRVQESYYPITYYQVSCNHCGRHTIGHYFDKQSAINAWNEIAITHNA